MIEWIKEFRFPEFADDDKTRLTRTVLFISYCIIIACIYPFFHLLVNENWGSFISVSVIFGAGLSAIFLVSVRHVKWAANVLSFSLLPACFYMLITGDGSHDIAILTYPGILVIGSILLSNRGYGILLFLNIASMGLISWLEMEKILVTRLSEYVKFSDFTDIISLLLVTGIALKLLIRDFQKSLERVRRQRSELNRKNAELESHTRDLAESAARWKSLVENTPDLILNIRPDGFILFSNHRESVPASFTSALNYFDSDGAGNLVKAIRTCTKTRQPVQLELQSTESTGRKWYSVRLNPIFSGKVVDSLTLILTDITHSRKMAQDQKLLEAKIYQTQKMESLGTLAGGIAHDFNNILSIIMTHAGGLEAQSGNPEKLRKKSEAILSASERGAGLVRQILTFARRDEPKTVLTDVNAGITEALLMLDGTFPKSLEIRWEPSKYLPKVLIDPGHLYQIMLNLCINARDAMNGNGILSVGTSLENSESDELKNLQTVKISISDTGSGIPDEIKDRIFEPFFTTKEAGKGTGLGLSLVYGMVQSAGGRIEVESELGKGTTFVLYLPVHEAAESKIPTGVSSDQKLESSAQFTVLLVEDEPAFLSQMTFELENSGIRVLTASSGADALEKLGHLPYRLSVMVTNLDLPGIGGLEVCREAKLKYPGLPVLISSGYISAFSQNQLREMGITTWLFKPYPLKNLTQAIFAELAHQ
ncbi:MAG: response regulator [Bacteroidetes bacterium]|nr:response regulator [Bacteroidota bacterium]